MLRNLQMDLISCFATTHVLLSAFVFFCIVEPIGLATGYPFLFLYLLDSVIVYFQPGLYIIIQPPSYTAARSNACITCIKMNH